MFQARNTEKAVELVATARKLLGMEEMTAEEFYSFMDQGLIEYEGDAVDYVEFILGLEARAGV